MLDVRDRTSRTGEEQRPEPRCGKAYWPVQDSSFSLLGVKSHLAFPTALQHVVLCVCPLENRLYVDIEMGEREPGKV